MKGVSELIGELQVQLGILIRLAEEGNSVPEWWLDKARKALDESYGREVVSK